MDTIKTATAYSFDPQGVQHPQYWQGAGVSGTSWRACYTGYGTNEHDAATDAIEQAAQSENIPAALGDAMQARADMLDSSPWAVCDECEYADDCDETTREECELAFYVVLFVR